MSSINSQQELVVGVDFGTTYTGLSYICIPSDGVVKGTLFQDLQIMCLQGKDEIKIPTKICYCGTTSMKFSQNCSPAEPNQERPYKWGLEAQDCSKMPYMFFKLQLATNSETRDDLTQESQYGTCEDCEGGATNTSPTKLFIDYLSAMRTKFMQHIVEMFPEKKLRIDWVFTVPACFNKELRDKLLKDYLPQAGFTGETTRTIRHILEPEAAAVRVLSQALMNPNAEAGLLGLKEGDSILICDGGGGTIDLLALRIDKMERSGENRIPYVRMEPLIPPDSKSCAMWGSMDIDKAFDAHLDEIFKAAIEELGRTSSNMKWHELKSAFAHDRREALKTFETYKMQFTGAHKTDWVWPIFLEKTLQSLSLPKFDVVQGVLNLSSQKMKGFFDTVLAEMIHALESQLVPLEKQKISVRAMVLVGGLGASRFIQNRIKTWANTRYSRRNTQINVISFENPNDATSAVMCGATQHGLQQVLLGRPTSTCIMPVKSYGIVVDEPYDQDKHGKTETYQDPVSHTKMVRNQIRWLIKKGIPVPLKDQGPTDAVVSTSIPIFLQNKPPKDKLQLPETSKYLYFTMLECDSELNDLPKQWSNSVRHLHAGTVKLYCGPFDGLTSNFAYCLREDASRFTKSLGATVGSVFSSRGYWEGSIEIRLHLESGDGFFMVADIKDSVHLAQDFSEYEAQMRARRMTTWVHSWKS